MKARRPDLSVWMGMHLAQWALLTVIAIAATLQLPTTAVAAGTAKGEIEARPAPVGRRFCLGGLNYQALCNEDGDCPGSTCKDRNIFNLSVAVQYDAPAGDITAVENMIGDLSGVLLDITDGQAQIGVATVNNNAFGTTQADLRVYPSTCTTGTSIGAACGDDDDCPPNVGANQGRCGVWWWSETGSFRNGGSMHVSINHVDAAADPGNILAHEFTHLVFDARDEYQTRPGCGNVEGNSGSATCPHQDAIDAGEDTCLMDHNGSELCWGHGDPADTTDISGGNHDADLSTEQSECRDGRSCWDQVVWAWPNTFLKPAAAPDPGTAGAVLNPTHFVQSDDTMRVVLVLDESGSMDRETPMRIERLQVAARNFVALADDDAEVGLVSFASDAETASGRARVAVDALSVNRGTLTAAIGGLVPDTRTNIGDGLDKAKQLIADAGGVTANTFILLMTDGRNNEPQPQVAADADLDAALADLLAAGIPVYVTCTGGDTGLQSQCAEIANGTNGFFVDSADAGRLPEAFVDFHERMTGHESISSRAGSFAKMHTEPPAFYVDQGSDSAAFVLLWKDPAAAAAMSMKDPDGKVFQAQAMEQGRFIVVSNPRPGDWTMQIDPRWGAAGRYVARGYTRNRVNNLIAALRHPTVLPGEEMYVFAYPKAQGMGITHPTQSIHALVQLPDGSTDTLELHDRGRDPSGGGDDLAGDGTFTGVFRNTAQKGPYQFLIRAEMEDWTYSHEAHVKSDAFDSPRFVREVRLSGAVGSPGDVVVQPEDDPRPGAAGSDDDGQVVRLLWLILLLVLVGLLMLWFCCCRRRLFG